MSIVLSKKAIRRNWPVIILMLFVVLLIGLTAYQQVAFAGPATGDPLTEPSSFGFGECYDCGPPPVVPPPPPPPAGNNINADKKCKMLVFPSTITLGEPFEVCWIGDKFSDVKLGPISSLTPNESSPYITQLDNGKGLFCHSFTVPSINNTDLDPGTYDFRCIGAGGTVFQDNVMVVSP
ncbi:MAG: hypothetical protein DWQ07_01270 [Chloroflexi bacterium]|nr:MAG: hypothetical protein DWQ07_01270 [Chloroflexota bacterium]MBL1196486.1 hypothetical protein [Chloroflexota bacterium]NOH13781.1 hypothetical protein [Chloroflexota bacterium]